MNKANALAFGLVSALGFSAWVVIARPLDPPAGPVAPTYRTLDEVTPTWSRTISGPERFQLVMGGAGVLDLETGLVWEQTPNGTFVTHGAAMTTAINKNVGGRKGWRLPTLDELMTLIDMTQTSPRLPAGHPFGLPQPSGWQSFWTNTKVYFDGNRIWEVDLLTGNAVDTTTINLGQAWLVRGGSNSQPRP